MNERQIERWATTRAKGRQRYVWLYGVALWGCATGVLWSIVMSAMQGWDRLPFYLPSALVGFPIGGYIWGAWTWKKFEGEYQKALAKETSD